MQERTRQMGDNQEKMFALQAEGSRLKSTLEKLESLRAQGRTRSATYQQLLAQKLTLKDFLSRIDLFVR